MSLLRTFHPDIRLKRVLSEPGGIKISEALTCAEAGVESVRAQSLSAVDDKIEEIGVHAATSSDESLERCYVLANEIFAEAGIFGLSELSAAALNLCQLLSARDRERAFPTGALRVHVESMRALRSPAVAENQALRETVLSELRNLAAKLVR
jgi:hypothetical protein